jgi:hypothetical protein
MLHTVEGETGPAPLGHALAPIKPDQAARVLSQAETHG